MAYLRQTKRTETIVVTTREYERALRTLKQCAMKAGRQPSRENIQNARNASDALAVATTSLRRAEHAEGIKLALTKLTEVIEQEGGQRARSIAAFRIVDLMRELFTASR